MPLILVPGLGGEECDFCSDQPVVKIYACRNFLVPGTKHMIFQQESVGGWAACSHCSRLIDEDKWIQLTERSVSKFQKKHGIPRYECLSLRQQFKDIHQQFKKHMIREV